MVKLFLVCVIDETGNEIPEETVFIDDKKENIEAASKLGFLTIHLTNPEIITQEINTFI